MLTTSNISGFHLMLNLKVSRNLAKSKMIAYSIRAINMKRSDTNAKTDIPVKDSESGKISWTSLTICICTKNNVTSKVKRPGMALGGTI